MAQSLDETVIEVDPSLFYVLWDKKFKLRITPSVCNCGHYRCRGLYIKTHVCQSECLFSFKDKGLDIFLPTASEIKKLQVDKMIKDLVPMRKFNPKGWTKKNHIDTWRSPTI